MQAVVSGKAYMLCKGSLRGLMFKAPSLPCLRLFSLGGQSAHTRSSRDSIFVTQPYGKEIQGSWQGFQKRLLEIEEGSPLRDENSGLELSELASFIFPKHTRKLGRL